MLEGVDHVLNFCIGLYLGINRHRRVAFEFHFVVSHDKIKNTDLTSIALGLHNYGVAHYYGAVKFGV